MGSELDPRQWKGKEPSPPTCSITQKHRSGVQLCTPSHTHIAYHSPELPWDTSRLPSGGLGPKLQKTTTVSKHVRKWNPCAPLVGMKSRTASMENSMAVPQNIKNRITPWSSNSTSASIPRRIESRISNIFGHPLFTKAKKCSQMMHGETEWGLYGGMSLSLKEGGRTDTGYSLDESWEYYPEWNKPDAKGQILDDSTHSTSLECQIYRDGKKNGGSQGWWRRTDLKVGEMRKFWKWMVMVVAQQWEST